MTLPGARRPAAMERREPRSHGPAGKAPRRASPVRSPSRAWGRPSAPSGGPQVRTQDWVSCAPGTGPAGGLARASGLGQGPRDARSSRGPAAPQSPQRLPPGREGGGTGGRGAPRDPAVVTRAFPGPAPARGTLRPALGGMAEQLPVPRSRERDRGSARGASGAEKPEPRAVWGSLCVGAAEAVAALAPEPRSAGVAVQPACRAPCSRRRRTPGSCVPPEGKARNRARPASRARRGCRCAPSSRWPVPDRRDGTAGDSSTTGTPRPVPCGRVERNRQPGTASAQLRAAQWPARL